jgi:hypothetical protein
MQVRIRTLVHEVQKTMYTLPASVLNSRTTFCTIIQGKVTGVRVSHRGTVGKWGCGQFIESE